MAAQTTVGFGDSTFTTAQEDKNECMEVTKKKQEETTIANHYTAHSTESYEAAFFLSSGDYCNYLNQLTSAHLHLHATPSSSPLEPAAESMRVLDLGGGTGKFARDLVEIHDHLHVVVVEPFLEHTAVSNNHNERISFVKAPAESFIDATPSAAAWTFGYDRLLLKEMIHHLAPSDRVAILTGLHQALRPDPTSRLLVTTRPQVEMDYPMWPAARAVWENNQPTAESLCRDIQAAGFHHVRCSLQVYPVAIPLDIWRTMIVSRFWSTFYSFTDDELRAGCDQIEADYQDRIDDNGLIHFEDRLIFISACRSDH